MDDYAKAPVQNQKLAIARRLLQLAARAWNTRKRTQVIGGKGGNRTLDPGIMSSVLD